MLSFSIFSFPLGESTFTILKDDLNMDAYYVYPIIQG